MTGAVHFLKVDGAGSLFSKQLQPAHGSFKRINLAT